MPSTVTRALSLVMTSCWGTSITCAMTFILRPIGAGGGAGVGGAAWGPGREGGAGRRRSGEGAGGCIDLALYKKCACDVLWALTFVEYSMRTGCGNRPGERDDDGRAGRPPVA